MSGTCKLTTVLFVDTDLRSKTTKKNEGMINSKFRVDCSEKRVEPKGHMQDLMSNE